MSTILTRREDGDSGRPKPPPLALPDENTDAGAMTRLFIAEVAVPGGGDMKEARRAMDWMRCVLMNRLKHPSDFSADKHATQIIQIISAQRTGVQFQGFQNYPIIDRPQKNNIDQKMSIAGKEVDNQTRYSSFIRAAIAAATDPAPADPTPSGLYFWMTVGWPKPSPDAVFYETLGGNNFYSWNRPTPKDRHPHKTGTLSMSPRNGPFTYDHKRPVSK